MPDTYKVPDRAFAYRLRHGEANALVPFPEPEADDPNRVLIPGHFVMTRWRARDADDVVGSPGAGDGAFALVADYNALITFGQSMLETMRRLLAQVGDAGSCNACGRGVYWLKHSNGRRAPYTDLGVNHFVDCPKADQFRSKGRRNG